MGQAHTRLGWWICYFLSRMWSAGIFQHGIKLTNSSFLRLPQQPATYLQSSPAMASTYNICHIINWVKLRNGHTLRPHYISWVSQPARPPSAYCCFECSSRLKQSWTDTSHTSSSRSWLSLPCHLQAIVLVNVNLYQSGGILLLPATVTTFEYT